MTRDALIDAVRRAADQPNESYQRRRKGMDAETATNVLRVVLEAVREEAEARGLDKDWNGSSFLAQLGEWLRVPAASHGRNGAAP